MNLIIYILAGFLLTLGGIKFFLEWLKKNQILDVPNERSSHQNPTPVGGGIVIVVVSLVLFFGFLFINDREIPWSYFLGAILVVIISWLDDLYSIPVYLRFLFHSLAALLVIFGIGLSGNIFLPVFGGLEIGKFSYLVWYFWIVWLINAYNFMDGIDGIAGLQAVLAGIGWAFVGYLQGITEIEIYGTVIAASCAGFLIFNWQPAKIFMGDVGSAFLGYTFAVFPMFFQDKGNSGSNNFLFIAILFVWLFVFDTVRTFLLRLLKGEPIWKAHRKHLYQQLIIKGLSHQTVAVIYGVLALLISIATVLKVYQNTPNDFVLLFIIVILSIGLAVFTYLKKASSLET